QGRCWSSGRTAPGRSPYPAWYPPSPSPRATHSGNRSASTSRFPAASRERRRLAPPVFALLQVGQEHAVTESFVADVDAGEAVEVEKQQEDLDATAQGSDACLGEAGPLRHLRGGPRIAAVGCL